MKHLVGDAFRGKKVLVTGHTGFKGSWLCLWLNKLGAKVYGLALLPSTSPAMFDLCDIKATVNHVVGDVCDFQTVRARLSEVQPDVIFHLAAQPLVRRSYADPIQTVMTNVVGTANLLEAAKALEQPCAIVVVSSDKCYENRGWTWGYRENDPLGGFDPYSMSKAATELVTASWRQSFFHDGKTVRLASARAGNVIGGGDWADDRIVPDCVRAFTSGNPVILRNPNATRPWQHVLEPLAGYLMLAANLLNETGNCFCSAWNFGPAPSSVVSVANIVEQICEAWGEKACWKSTENKHPHEASLLSLSSDKSIHGLGWKPVWDISTTVHRTTKWYRVWHTKREDLFSVTNSQIDEYTSAFEGTGRIH